MDKNESKKAAIIRMLQIYLKHGSKISPLRQTDFVRYLKEEYGIEIERKTVGRNIILLKEMGFDIRNAKQGTYLGGNDPSASVISVITGKEIGVDSEKEEENESDETILPSRYKAKPEECELIADKDLMDRIDFWLGSGTKYAEYPEDKSKIRAIGNFKIDDAVNFAKRFFPKVELVSPPSARNMIVDHLVQIAEVYIGKQKDQ